MLDYYAILEVSSSATTTEVKKSYRRLARLHHPDLNQDALDTHIKRLNEAYEVLRDPMKRAAYDMQLREKKQRAEAQAAYNVANNRSNANLKCHGSKELLALSRN